MHVSIVRAMNTVVTTTVAHEHRRMVHEEPSPVVAAVHVERPSAVVPADGTIEVVQCHISVILPAIQHEAEVCVTTIPPDAKHVTMTRRGLDSL